VSAAPPPDAAAPPRERLRAGIGRGLGFSVAVFIIAISFGVLARPVLGSAAPIVMSIVMFSGSAQFAVLAILGAGGGAGAAIAAGVLLSLRFVAMGVALAPSLRHSVAARAGFGMSIIDASWAAGSRGDGSFDPWFMLGATVPQYPAWVLGTVAGILLGDVIGDPHALGIDALFPAFFVGLLFEEVRTLRHLASAGGGAAIAAALTPVVPAGLPILAAALAAVAVSRWRGGDRPLRGGADA
jgi:predicted branched-subunit amino acid permease